MENLIFITILALLFMGFLTEQYLGFLNLKNWNPNVPAFLLDHYPQQKYAKARDYTLKRHRLGLFQSYLSFAIILLLIFTDSFALLDDLIATFSKNESIRLLLFFGILGFGADLISLPFQWIATFKIEAEFGFNKTTPSTFVFDKIKGYFLALIFGGGLMWIITSIYESDPQWFWLYAWGVLAAFSLFMSMFYSNIIVPLFNKQSPLPEGELRSAINAFASKAGFKVKNIYVINGSKRSTKANAYFTGLGPKKRIVLYDTLIEKHSTDELVAVLAHEIGHYKKKHTLLGLGSGLLQSFIMFYLFSLIAGNAEFTGALGMEPSFHAAILVFALLYSPVSLLIGLIEGILSRKHEFAADRYAAEQYSAKSLSNALIKLSAENLSNLTPHPAYVFVYHSHPPLLERLKAMEKENSKLEIENILL